MYDPPVQIHKTVLMQRILDAVSRGYLLYTAGKVPADKAQRLAGKFATRYAVHRNENQRAYARRKGRANARLFLYAPPNDTDLRWWLCVTSGAGAVHELEKLADARNRHTRVWIEEDYELIQLSRKKGQGTGTVWTWRMTHGCDERWRLRLRHACRTPGTSEIRLAIGSLSRTPGFSGIRRQVGDLMVFARAEWRRRHGNLDRFPGLLRLRYVERLSNTAVPLTAWKRRSSR